MTKTTTTLLVRLLRREHVERAWVDMQRYKEQKDKDLREALINYAVMQISMCKKGIQMWSNTKECFLKM